MANEKKARNSAKDHAPMSAERRKAIKQTQPKPAFIGMNCVGGGKGALRSISALARHIRKHPNDYQATLIEQGVDHAVAMQPKRDMFRCSACGTGYYSANQVDHTLIKGKRVLTCHTCRDKGVNRRKTRPAGFIGVSLVIAPDFREKLPTTHSREKIEDTQDNFAHLCEKRRFRGPALSL